MPVSFVGSGFFVVDFFAAEVPLEWCEDELELWCDDELELWCEDELELWFAVFADADGLLPDAVVEGWEEDV